MKPIPSFGDRSSGDRSSGNRPSGDRSSDDRPSGDRFSGGRSSGAVREAVWSAEPEERSRLRRYLRRIPILLAAGAALNVVLVCYGSERLPGIALDRIRWPYVLLAAAAAFVPWMTRSARIRVWSRFFGIRLGFLSSLRVVLGSELTAAVTPTAIGGGPAKAAFLYREGFTPGGAVLITALGSLEDAIFFAISVPLAALLSPRVAPGAWMEALSKIKPASITVAPFGLLGAVAVLGLLGVLAAGCWWVARRRSRWLDPLRSKLGRIRPQLRESLGALRRGGFSRLGITLPLAAVQWTARYGVISLLVLGLGGRPDPAQLFLFQAVAFTFMIAVPSPGATGGAEGIFYVLHRGVVPGEILALALAGWRLLTFLLPVAVAAVLLVVIDRDRCLRRGRARVPRAGGGPGDGVREASGRLAIRRPAGGESSAS